MRLLGRALHEEESRAAAARQLVLACHQALLEQQETLSSLVGAAREHGAERARLQSDLAAEMRAAAAAVERAGVERAAALATARGKAEAAAQEVTLTLTLSLTPVLTLTPSRDPHPANPNPNPNP